ncbi:putative glutathione S-transferase [Capsicum annuum]|nr:putative glutathione S-transferase [Capsicum annuum]
MKKSTHVKLLSHDQGTWVQLRKQPLAKCCIRASIANTFFLNGEEQEKAKEEVCEMLKVLDNELKAKKFFVGDKFGFAANFVGHWLGVFVFGEMSILVVAKSRNIHFHKEELLAFAQARALASASASAKK